jgi:hypothetical protein
MSVKAWPADFYGARALLDPICTCHERDRLVLGAVVNYGSPVRCGHCQMEIDPTELFDHWLVVSLARWSMVHRALLDLFMEGAYSTWAGNQLATLASPVNKGALELLGYINRTHHCLYWLMSEAGSVEGRCPSCQSSMIAGQMGPSTVFVCEQCNLAVARFSASRLTSA